MKHSWVWKVGCIVWGFTAAGASEVRVDVLNLSLALEEGTRAHPVLRAKQAAREAAAGRLRQAGAWPNPVLDVSAEEVPAPSLQWSDGKHLVQIEQSLDLRGHLGAKERLSLVQVSLADADYESAALEVFDGIRERFAGVLVAQARWELARSAVRLAEEVSRIVAVQASVGAVSTIETTRAEMEVAAFAGEAETAEFQVDAAERQLQQAMGLARLTVGRYEGALIDEWPLPSWERLVSACARHPKIHRLHWKKEEAHAWADAVRSDIWPDLGVRLGVGRAAGTGSTIAQAGISVPLPVWNRLDGAVSEADAGIRVAQQEAETAAQEFEADVRSAYGRMEQALKQAKRYRETVLPGAEAVVQAMREGFQQGKFRLIEVLDAQRALADARRVRLDALSIINQLRWKLEALVGLQQKPEGGRHP